MGDSQSIVLHIAGTDRPGITSALTKIVADEGARLIDVGQSVLHGYLTLSAIIEIRVGSDALRKILFAVAELGLRLEVSAFDKPSMSKVSHPVAAGLCVTLLGELSDGKALSKTTEFLAENQLNIQEIKTLTSDTLSGLELTVDLPQGFPFSEKDLQSLRGRILELAALLKIDIAVQRDDIFRRNRRLVCLDVDSTFTQIEVIDELARLQGCGVEVAGITEKAMNGELDFKSALRERVRLLKGLRFEKARMLIQDIPLTPGAESLVNTLKSLGFSVGLVSGGFDFFVDELKRRFNLDFAFSNQLEVRGGLLTGEVLGTVVDAERKAQILRDMVQVFRCRIEQTVAVGDGANDILMLQSAGLGIAFQAKPRLQMIADLSLNSNRLDSLLMLMGFHERKLKNI